METKHKSESSTGCLLEQRQETTPPTSRVPGLSPGPDHDRLQAMGDRSVASSLCTGRSRLTPGFLSRSGSPEPMLSATRLMGRCLQPGQESRSCPQRQGTCALMGQSTGRLSHQVLLDQTQPREERTHTSIDCHSSLVHGTVNFFFFNSVLQKLQNISKKEVPPEDTSKKQAQRRRQSCSVANSVTGTGHSCLPDSRRIPANPRSEICPSTADHQKQQGQFPKRLAQLRLLHLTNHRPCQEPGLRGLLVLSAPAGTSCPRQDGLQWPHCSVAWTLAGGRATEAAPAGEQEHPEPLSPPAAPVAPPDSNPAQSCNSTFKTGQLLVLDLNFRISKHPTASVEVGEKHGCVATSGMASAITSAGGLPPQK